MNTKTIPLVLPETHKQINLVLSNFTQSSSLSAKFDGNTVLDYNKAVNSNKISNYGFETFTSASIISNWTIDNSWNSVSTTASPIENLPVYYYSGSAAAGIKLPLFTSSTITSASFTVTAGEYYQTSLQLMAFNGYMAVTTRLGYLKLVVYPRYSAQISWYNGASLVSDETIITGSGTTSTTILSEYSSVPLWRSIAKNVVAPSTANRALIKVTAQVTYWGFTDYPPTMTYDIYDLFSYPYTINYYKPALIYIDDTNFYQVSTSLITIAPSMAVSMTDGFNASTPETNLNLTTLTFSASSIGGGLNDCSGKDVGSIFQLTDNKLYFGRDDTGYWKSWIPFSIDFSGISKGAHVVSASLVLTAGTTQSYASDKTCKLKAGFETTINPTEPASWATLNSKIMNSLPFNDTIADTWAEGEQYNLNVTNTVKYLLGASTNAGTSTDGITWNNSASAAILITDGGSTTGTSRNCISTEGYVAQPVYLPPLLKIEYANNNYTKDVLDSYINSATGETAKVQYDNTSLYIGGNSSGSSRALMYFNLSSIPITATVTSASLCLYHEASQASNTGTIRCYKMLKEWDAYTASWNKQYGTKNWDGGAGSGSVVDYDGAVTTSGSYALSATEAVGWKNIPLSTTLAQNWIVSGSANYGVIIKTLAENGDLHKFTSSEGADGTYHPYMIVYYTVSGTPYTKTVQVSGTTSSYYSASEDSYVSSSSSEYTTNFGSITSFKVKGPSTSYKSLIKFSLSGAISTGLTAATLKVYCNTYNASDYISGILNVYRLLKNWSELSVTWQNSGYAAWSGAGLLSGSDYSSQLMGTITVTPYSTGWKNISLTSLAEVQNMITTNYGLVILTPTSMNSPVIFDSRTGTNPPQLYLYYV